MKRILALLTVLLSVAAVPAFAMSLDSAKAKGLVGERLDGYISAVSSSPSSDVASLVNTINSARKDEYAKIASRNGQPVSVVEKLAAAKLIERLDHGTYFMDKGGNWIKK
ncbi:MAG: YdbL family protein [Alphaproteobacteria bacterium]|nr:YdbL family protein [Alphaproteobacteria bacterium]